MGQANRGISPGHFAFVRSVTTHKTAAGMYWPYVIVTHRKMRWWRKALNCSWTVSALWWVEARHTLCISKGNCPASVECLARRRPLLNPRGTNGNDVSTRKKTDPFVRIPEDRRIPEFGKRRPVVIVSKRNDLGVAGHSHSDQVLKRDRAPGCGILAIRGRRQTTMGRLQPSHGRFGRSPPGSATRTVSQKNE